MREEPTEKDPLCTGSLPKCLQWLELGWSVASCQKLFSGLSCRCRDPNIYAIIFCFSWQVAGSCIKNGAAGAQTSPCMRYWCHRQKPHLLYLDGSPKDKYILLTILTVAMEQFLWISLGLCKNQQSCVVVTPTWTISIPVIHTSMGGP